MNKRISGSVTTALLLVFILVVSAGCGGGGGGAGAAADPVVTPVVDDPPAVSFTAPTSDTYTPSTLPGTVAFSYSDADGINTSSVSAVFTFQGTSFDFTNLLTVGASSASAAPDVSPMRWTVVSKYSVATHSLLDKYKIFGTSSGATALLNHVDVDDQAGILIVASTSRKKLVFIKLSDGTTLREVSLSAESTNLRSCPLNGKVLVAMSGSSSIGVYDISTGALSATITLPAIPKSVSLNRVTSTAYVTYNNQLDLSIINCSDNSVTTGTFQNQPQLIEVDGESAGKLFYVGGIGGDRGIYQYAQGADVKLAGLDSNPDAMSYDKTRGVMAAAYYGNDTTAFYNLSSGQKEHDVAVGDQPFSIGASADASKAFVLNKGDDNVSVVDSSSGTVLATLNLGGDPLGIVVDDAEGVFYVLLNIWEISTSSSGTLTVSVKDVNGNQGSSTLNVTIDPDGVGNP